MRLAFLYNEPSEDPAGQGDGNPASWPIVAALERSGHIVTPIACSLDLASIRQRLDHDRPDLAVNQVDSIGGSDAMMAVIPLLLDAIGLPYTGCPAAAIAATASKLAAKQQLVDAGLPTPRWVTADGQDCRWKSWVTTSRASYQKPQFIVKSVFEHASFQMDDAAVVVAAGADQVASILQEREFETGRPFFAEPFIDGREFNLSLWGNEPDVLPPAEIDFSTFPAEKPRIVGQRAKWVEDSFEHEQTVRRFHFPADDGPLLLQLRELAVDCWRLFGLRGYARVDFRVDSAGQPWILEVNCNPCLSPEAGFAAAWERADIAYDKGIERILELAISDSDQQIPFAGRRERRAMSKL